LKLSTIEFVNKIYGTSFTFKDNDITDSIAVGASYFKDLGYLTSQKYPKKLRRNLKNLDIPQKLCYTGIMKSIFIILILLSASQFWAQAKYSISDSLVIVNTEANHGTGFVVKSDDFGSYIITNKHVCRDYFDGKMGAGLPTINSP